MNDNKVTEINFKPIDDLPLHHIPVTISKNPKVTAEIYPNNGEYIITRNGRIINAKELAKQMKEFAYKKPVVVKDGKIFNRSKPSVEIRKIPFMIKDQDSKTELKEVITVNVIKDRRRHK